MIVRMSGGLGNQMFQYAFARALQEKRGGDLCLDLNFYFSHSERIFALDQYAVHYTALKNYIGYNKIRKYVQRLPIISAMLGIHKEKREYQIDTNIYKYHYKYYTGYWQNVQYFRGKKEMLKKELTYIGEITPVQGKLADRMENEESVAVHVRRGDYRSERYINVYYQQKEKYYRNAIKYIQERNDKKEIKIYFFSDDIKWCREVFGDIDNAEFIDAQMSGSPHIDMMLMRKCKYIIMANSTFSWWAAWLSDRVDSVVITPQYWFCSKKRNDKVLAALIEPEWIVLDT